MGFSTFMIECELAVVRQENICVNISITFGLGQECSYLRIR